MGHNTRRNYKSVRSRTVRSRSGRPRIKPKHILASRTLGNIPELGQRERERRRRAREQPRREREEREERERHRREREERERYRRDRELKMIQRKNRMDILFRSTEDITNMFRTLRLGDMPVKFFIISCHGAMSRKRVFRMPPHMAVFDLAENEYRGHTTCSSLDQPLLELIVGENGRSLPGFFNAMLGGRSPPDPSKLIPQISYRTPGQLAFNLQLSIQKEQVHFRNSLGCWDVTEIGRAHV